MKKDVAWWVFLHLVSALVMEIEIGHCSPESMGLGVIAWRFQVRSIDCT